MQHREAGCVPQGRHYDGQIFLFKVIFLNQVLKGEKMENIGSGKTLASGPNDNVFVYFTDHGAKGLVAFGENFLKATNLTSAIKEMHTAKKYNKMVFYVEACESGSMFKAYSKSHSKKSVSFTCTLGSASR